MVADIPLGVSRGDLRGVESSVESPCCAMGLLPVRGTISREAGRGGLGGVAS